MIRYITILLCIVVTTSYVAAAKPPRPQPLSYTKPIDGTPYTFVMLGDPEAEAKQKPEFQERFQKLHNQYKETGLYNDYDLLWSVDGPYAPYDNIFVSKDGKHLIRIEGDWYQTKDHPYPSGRRVDSKIEQAQLSEPAVSFFANGKLLEQYSVNDVVTSPESIPHSPEHVLWSAGGILNEEQGCFNLIVKDDHILRFDYKTGELLAKEQAGLNNPIVQPILISMGLLTVIMLGIWVWLVRYKWKPTS